MKIKQKLAAIFLLSIIVLGGGGYFLSYMFSKDEAFFISEADIEYYIEKPTIVTSVMLGNAKSASSLKSKTTYDESILPDMKANPLSETSGVGSGAASGQGLYSSSGSAHGAKSWKDESIVSTSGGSSSGLMAYGGSRGSSVSSGSSGGSGGMMGGTSGYSSPAAFVPMFNDNTTTSIPPSGDPDPGVMIPVGDGLWILMLLAAGYMFYIRKK